MSESVDGSRSQRNLNPKPTSPEQPVPDRCGLLRGATDERSTIDEFQIPATTYLIHKPIPFKPNMASSSNVRTGRDIDANWGVKDTWKQTEASSTIASTHSLLSLFAFPSSCLPFSLALTYPFHRTRQNSLHRRLQLLHPNPLLLPPPRHHHPLNKPTRTARLQPRSRAGRVLQGERNRTAGV